MAGITATAVDWRLFRRVLRLRSLVAGPLAMSDLTHEPVMVDEVLEAFRLAPGDVVVDGTIGLGGHAVRFIEEILPLGTLVGFDYDETMLERARRRIGEPQGVRVHLFHANFRLTYSLLLTLSLKADAFLLDLGLNSAQIDDPERGISFRETGPLDMRQNRSCGEPAASILNRMSPVEIETILREYGDERFSRNIGRAIVEFRRTKPLRTTDDLVECVLKAIPHRARDRRIHPATRTFQALRMYVNQELEGLDDALRGAAASLAEGGVLVVLSYHSGEDRIVKTTFRELAESGYEELYRKPLTPSDDEVRRNPRSRSAKMRAIRRVSSQ